VARQESGCCELGRRTAQSTGHGILRPFLKVLGNGLLLRGRRRGKVGKRQTKGRCPNKCIRDIWELNRFLESSLAKAR